MRFLIAVLTAGLAAVTVLAPQPAPSEPAEAPASRATPAAVCSVEEGSGRTTEIAAVADADGPATLTLFTGGQSAESITRETGSSGSVVIPVVDVAAVGTVGALVEMSSSSSAAGSLILGAESLAGESCASAPGPLAVVGGASTISGESFEVQLINPYAGEAVAEVTVVSESGVESNPSFESVVVAPGSSRVLDLTDLVPGRETLSVLVETTRGRAVGVARQGVDAKSAIWKAVEPAQDWFLPVPRAEGSRQLVVTTPIVNDVEYQVDVYGPGGLDQAILAGTLPARGQEVIDLNQFGEGPLVIRVVSTAPVVSTLRHSSTRGLGVTTGMTMAASRLFIPATRLDGLGWATIVVGNVGIDSEAVTIRRLGDSSSVRTVMMEADETIELAIGSADGILIESLGQMVAVWSGHRETASVLSIAVPVGDG